MRPPHIMLLIATVVAPLLAADSRTSPSGSGPAAAGTKLQIKEATARVNGLDLFYRVAGSGPPLLLLHGLVGAGADWDQFIGDFASDYTVIVPDLRGHGHSTNPGGTYTHPEVARDIFALLDHLEYSSVHAIGHSSGAMTLVTMAVMQPARVNAMVLLGAGHRIPASIRERFDQYQFAAAPVAAREYFLKIHPGGEPQINALFGYIHELGRNPDDPNFTAEQLKTIKARTLIVWGDRDGLLEVPFELHAAMVGSQLWIVPGQGHWPLWKRFGGSETAIQIFPSVVKEFFRPAAAPASPK